MMNIRSVPTAFIWRRVHSLMGLWLVVFLCEHLFVNFQAVMWIGDDGKNFVRLVNLLQDLPALQVVESVLIGVPILFHGFWGVKRIWDAKLNSWPSDGSKPSLPYVRNFAFSWQRLSSWILILGIIVHVTQVRFIDNPKKAFVNHQEVAMVKVTSDDGLLTLAHRLEVSLYSPERISALEKSLGAEKEGFLQQLKSYHLKEGAVVAVAPDRGRAILLTVRDILKNPWMDVLYTFFVLAAVFHAMNGLWTFLITWGVILSAGSQKLFSKLSLAGMTFLAFLALSTIWLTYWVNLRA